MNENMRKSALVSFLLAVFVLLAIITGWSTIRWITSSKDTRRVIYSYTSTWDLQELLIKDEIYWLQGPVEYIPNALLTPQEFKEREKEAVIGYPDQVSQFATSRMRILLPDDGFYAFNRSSIDYAHRLYVNGELAAETGSPGETKKSNVPGSANIFFTAKAENGVIELIQQGSNFVHRKAESHAGWTINKRDLRPFLANHFGNTFLLWSLLTLFIVYIFLFLLMKEQKGNLFFALFCLIWFLRIGVTGSNVFSVFIPSLPWVLKFKIEYMSFPVTAAMILLLLDFLFPNILQKWFRYTIYAVSAVIAGIFIFADTVFMSYSLLWCEAVYAPGIIFIIVRFAMKLRKAKMEQIIFLAGVFVFFLATIHDMFYHNDYFGLIPRIYRIDAMTPIAMLLLIYCQAAALFLTTIQMMKKTAAENAALKEHNRMMEQQLATYRMHYEDIIELVESNQQIDASFCENTAVNAVVLYYFDIAKNEGISVETELDIPQDTGSVPAMDVCIIVGGLFENALKAIRRVKHDEKYIRAISSLKAKSLNIEMINSFDADKSDTAGFTGTTAEEKNIKGEGMWLSSVRAVCAKHTGKVEKKITENLCKITAQVRTQSAKELPLSNTSLENTFKEHGLSKRESEVAHLLVKGLTAEEIGEHLFISESTVRIHIWKIYSKFGTTNRSGFMTLFVNSDFS